MGFERTAGNDAGVSEQALYFGLERQAAGAEREAGAELQPLNLLSDGLASDSKKDFGTLRNAPDKAELLFNAMASYLCSLPENQVLSSDTLFKGKELAEGKEALGPVLEDFKTIERRGSQIIVRRDAPAQVPLKRDILEGKASADHLKIDKELKFEISPDRRAIKNLEGVSLSVAAFGTGKELPVKELNLNHEENGRANFTIGIGDALPEAARDILAMPDLIQIPLDTEDGRMKIPRSSTFFSAIAESAGETLPGMLFSDVFRNLGEISLFAEKNPKWVHDVIKPMFEEVQRQAMAPATPPAEKANNDRIQKEQEGEKDQIDPIDKTEQTDQLDQKKQREQEEQEGQRKPEPAESKLEKLSKSGDYDQVLVIDGVERHYTLHLPPSYDGSKPLPLLLMLHGRGSSGKEFAERTRMNEKADQEGFAVAYPDATKWFGRKDLSAWDASNGLVPPGQKADDLQFLRTVIERSQSQLNLDADRIYMIGHSSGGMMTYLAATELSDKLAAVGTVSAAMSGKEPKPKFPVSVISTHGTRDEVIPISGLEGVPPILSELGIPTFKTPDYATEFWKRQNGIKAEATIEKIGELSKERFENSRNGSAVYELTFDGSGHTPDHNLKVYDQILDFLKKHPKASGKVAPSNDPLELIDDRHSPLDAVFEDIEKRGANGIGDDAARLYKHAIEFSDGSISPSELLRSIENKISIQVQSPLIDLVRRSRELAKNGNRISLETDGPTAIPLEKDLPMGSLKSLTLDDLSFRLDSRNGNPCINQIKGLSLDLRMLGQDRSINLKELRDKTDRQGNHSYRFQFDSPVPAALRVALFVPQTVNVEMKVNTQDQLQVINEKEVKNDLLGFNPVFRGYLDTGMDLAAAVNSPSMSSVLNVQKDLSIVGGFALLGRMVPRFKLASALFGSLLAAPATIHVLHD